MRTGLFIKFSICFVLALMLVGAAKLTVDSCLFFYGDEFSRLIESNSSLPEPLCEFIRESERMAKLESTHEEVPSSFLDEHGERTRGKHERYQILIATTDFTHFTFFLSKIPGSAPAMIRLFTWLTIFSFITAVLWEWWARINESSQVGFWDPGDEEPEIRPEVKRAQEEVLDEFYEIEQVGVPDVVVEKAFQAAKGSEATPRVKATEQKKLEAYISGIFSSRGKKSDKNDS